MDITILKAAPEHTKEISRICSIGWRQTVQGAYTHVAIVDGKVAGTIGGAITSPGIGEIYVFYVDESHRYKGIGAKLLEAFTKQQIEKGAIEQYVSVQEGNELGIPFYKVRGFQQQEKNERYRRKLI